MMNPDRLARASRRRYLNWAGRVGVAGIVAGLALPARSELREVRTLKLAHTHTGEHISLAYVEGGRYVPEALGALNQFLRDHYSGVVGAIDPKVFDFMHRVQKLIGGAQTFEIISGFRDADTNARLRASRGGGVARHSLHVDGRAIDVRSPGVSLNILRDAALSLRAGGVGYYARENFVHLDIGAVRQWGIA
jgi:uncharacterized protein YcbK (DUF882 family)